MIKKVEVGMFITEQEWDVGRLLSCHNVMRVDEILSLDTTTHEMLYRGSVVTLPDLVAIHLTKDHIYKTDLATASRIHFKMVPVDTQEAK